MTGRFRPSFACAASACLLLLLCGCSSPRMRPAPVPVFSTVVEEPPPFAAPFQGAIFPQKDNLMPNSPRRYRGGIHEGVDFYTREGGEFIGCGEKAFSVTGATVIRADIDWPEMKREEYEALTLGLKSVHDDASLDRLRGRQVWLLLDDGTVVKYCHLSSVDKSLTLGKRVARGDGIGAVGNTGTAEGARGSELNCHLHFEVWPSSTAFLGSGMAPREAALLYHALFRTSCRAGEAGAEEEEHAGVEGPGGEGL